MGATTSAPEPGGGRSDGAAAAFSERLYTRHRRMVLGLCRALLRDAVEAEDAAQQAFLSAHRALLNGAEPREPAAWLATIARNECWSRTRARMREPLSAAIVDGVAAADDPVQEAIRRADLRALWRAIEQLPRQQRDALLLREFGGLRYDELAVALAVSEPSVESLLFRARTRLRTQLAAAYSALSGAAWLEQLVRLVVGGGAPAVATKAVALGLGAAAVTGSAVVAPKMLEHHPAPRPHPQVVRHVAARTPTTVEAAATPTPPPVVRPATSARAPVMRPEHEAPRREAEHVKRPATTESESHEGERTATTAAATTVTTTEERVSGDSHEGPGGPSGESGRDGETATVAPSTDSTLTTDGDGGGGSDGRH